MADDRFCVAQFCDDVRQEVGNKVSLMGCYGPDVLLLQLPAVLPKFCVQIRLYTPVSRPFERVALRVTRDGTAIAEMSLSPEAIASVPTEPPEYARWQILIAHIAMAPFPIEAPCKLRVEAECEDGIVSSGVTRVGLAVPPQ